MYILAFRNARLLRVNLLRLVNVRQAKSSVFLWLPFLIFYSPQLSLNEGLVSLASVASVESDSACVALRFQVKFNS